VIEGEVVPIEEDIVPPACLKFVVTVQRDKPVDQHHRLVALVTSRPKKAKFLNFRHTGASHIVQRGHAARQLLAVVKMMGDTSVATVNRHYFNMEDDVMQEIIDRWAVADVEVFAADLEPVCADAAPADDDAPAVTVQAPPRPECK
jgi:hypothetical protein